MENQFEIFAEFGTTNEAQVNAVKAALGGTKAQVSGTPQEILKTLEGLKEIAGRKIWIRHSKSGAPLGELISTYEKEVALELLKKAQKDGKIVKIEANNCSTKLSYELHGKEVYFYLCLAGEGLLGSYKESQELRELGFGGFAYVNTGSAF